MIKFVKRKPLLIVAVVCLVVILMAACVFMLKRQMEYSNIQKAVQSQNFSANLGKAQQSTYECYEKDRRVCRAIKYTIDGNQCKDILSQLQRSSTAKKFDCNFAASTFDYDGKQYSVLLGSQDGVVSVHIWLKD